MGFFGGKDKPVRRSRPIKAPNHGQELEQMASWLAHPNEYGVRPLSVTLKRVYQKIIIWNNQGRPSNIHLIDYVMPGDRKGRGFVGPITWSFMGEEIHAISDDDIVLAYTGWAFLFPGLQDGSFEKNLDESARPKMLAHLAGAGATDVHIQDHYKIGEEDVLEFTGLLDGKRMRGAGSPETKIHFTDDMPQFHLPAVYFLLGHIQNDP